MSSTHPLGLTPGEAFAAAMYRQPEGKADEPCPRPCTACGPEHHWLDSSFDPDDLEEFDPPAELVAKFRETGDDRHTLYWACKHCSAWREVDGPCSKCGKSTMNPYRLCRACGGQHDMA